MSTRRFAPAAFGGAVAPEQVEREELPGADLAEAVRDGVARFARARRGRDSGVDGAAEAVVEMPGAWTSYLSCACCGLSLRVTAAWLAIDHCPRCVARRGRLVSLERRADPDRAER